MPPSGGERAGTGSRTYWERENGKSAKDVREIGKRCLGNRQRIPVQTGTNPNEQELQIYNILLFFATEN
ncbi:hypothetical protein JCM10003_814 [Bacteroides pyogenes JCM 10003]|nr:hypothetical protein JCM10003_814 [Bacteroides pyogenes JCM 10003]